MQKENEKEIYRCDKTLDLEDKLTEGGEHIFAFEIITNSVESSNVERIGYDAGRQVLEVQFRGGSRYRYKYVPQYIFDELSASPSKGEYLSKKIKGIFMCFPENKKPVKPA